VKPGVFQIAKSLGAVVVPIGFHSTCTHIFKKSWNQARLPLPFSKVLVLWGEPFAVDTEADPRDTKLAQKLEAQLAATGQDACNLIASR
jgi:lysophospholipid acyltransferase (LPLAT)-like uncharacterized protein